MLIIKNKQTKQNETNQNIVVGEGKRKESIWKGEGRNIYMHIYTYMNEGKGKTKGKLWVWFV